MGLEKCMAYLKWLSRILLFLLLLGFSVRNLDPVTLNFFLGYQWHEPLVVVLLAFTLMGVLFGLLAILPMFVRQRRDMAKLQREIRRKDEMFSVQHGETSSRGDVATAGHGE